jgi:hypothetical protein
MKNKFKIYAIPMKGKENFEIDITMPDNAGLDVDSTEQNENVGLNNDKANELLEVTDLKYSPMLKELLIMYVSRQYEENARYENYYLMAEYELLKRDNKLDLLFIEERLTNILNSDEQDE